MHFFKQIEFIVLGFLLVLTVLSMLALLTALIGLIFENKSKVRNPKDDLDRKIDKKKTAVIAAASSAIIDEPHKVTSIE